MHCPFCGADDTKVIDSRLVAGGDQVRRRRQCLTCDERYTTFETAELVMPRIVKRDGNREPFNEDKLRAGLQRALEISPDTLAVLISLGRVQARLGRFEDARTTLTRARSLSPESRHLQQADELLTELEAAQR